MAPLYSVSAGGFKVGQEDTGEPVRSYIWKREQQADTVPSYRATCNHSLYRGKEAAVRRETQTLLNSQ